MGIPSLARSCCVDRVVVGFEDNPDLTTGNKPALAELLLPLMEVPTCVIGRLASFSRNMFTRSITLAISQDSECDVQLGFASRLAQELHARLTLLHVFNRKDEDESPQTAEAFVSWRRTGRTQYEKVLIGRGAVLQDLVSWIAFADTDLGWAKEFCFSPRWRRKPGHKCLSSLG